MSHRTIEVIVGVVTLVGLAILITVTANLKRSTIFSRKYPLIAYFENVKRLEPGAPVLVHGVVCGDVRRIEASGRRDYPVRVTLMLRKGTILRAGAQARVISAGLVGETEISLEDTSPTARELEPGAEIYGVPTMDIPELLRQAPTVVSDLQESIGALKEILTDERARRSWVNFLESASSITIKINQSLGDSSGEITQAIRNLRAASEQLNRLLARADATVTTFGRDLSAAGANFGATVEELRTSTSLLMDQLNSVASGLKETTQRANQFLTTAENILAENRGDARRAIAGITSASVHLGQILARADEGKGPLGEVILGRQAHADLSGSLSRLQDSMEILRRWLEGLDRWVTGSDGDRRRVQIVYEGVSTGTLRAPK